MEAKLKEHNPIYWTDKIAVIIKTYVVRSIMIATIAIIILCGITMYIVCKSTKVDSESVTKDTSGVFVIPTGEDKEWKKQLRQKDKTWQIMLQVKNYRLS